MLRFRPLVSLSSLCLGLAVGCDVLEELPTDAGSVDAGSRNDGGDSPDVGLPSDCPSSDDFVGDPAWPYSFRVDPSARLCGLVAEEPLRTAPSKAVRIQLIPGTYRLPDSPGAYTMRLPFCAEGRAGAAFALGGPSPLNLDHVPLGADTYWLYRLEQSFSLGGQALVLDVGIDVFKIAGVEMPPPLVLDEQRDHGRNPDTSVTYLSCEEPCGEPLWFEPCATPGEGELYSVRFDRGRLDMRVRVYPAFGPTGPAALTQASGTLNGASFTQSDFFKLAHRPDHHNHGGGFYVRFDSPIGDVCGIEVEVPSRDGGWATLGGRLVDCSLETIEELSGLVLEGG